MTPTCFGGDDRRLDQTHAPVSMEPFENAVGDTQYRCPECGVVVE